MRSIIQRYIKVGFCQNQNYQFQGIPSTINQMHQREENNIEALNRRIARCELGLKYLAVLAFATAGALIFTFLLQMFNN